MARKTEIRALTGFRGVAAVLVAIYHLILAIGDAAPFSVGSGYIAVDAFFVLSGYVLAYNYASIFEDGISRTDYREFLIKRICRVYPVYLAILILATLKLTLSLGGGTPVTLNAWDAVVNLLMLTGWGLHAKAVIGVSWSVSAELFCYLLFPLIVMINRRSVFFLLMVTAASFAAIVALVGLAPGVEGPMDIVSSDNSLSLVRALFGFILGVAGYALSGRTILHDHRIANFGLPIVLIALLAIWFPDRSDLVKYVLIVAIVWLIAQGSTVGEALFGNRPIYFLGEISYSLYLVHTLLSPAFAKIFKRLSAPLGVDLAFAVSLCSYLLVAVFLSYISYLAFEKWGKTFMLRMLMPRRQAPL